MVAVLVVFRNVIDDYGPTAVTNFVADRGFDTELSPGSSPKAISSRTAHATQRSCVTRATAAKPIPVVRQMTSRTDATASMREIAEMSAVRALSSKETGTGVVGAITWPPGTDPSLSIVAASTTVSSCIPMTVPQEDGSTVPLSATDFKGAADNALVSHV